MESPRRLVEVRLEGRTCVIALRRGEKLNALSFELERQLADALETPEASGSACIILTGESRAFSTGADVTELRDLTPASVLAYYRETGGVYEQVAGLDRPTLAAISGYCLGGGFELALAADFRIADETAIFGFPEVAMGILPSSGGTHRLVRLVGPAKAKELALLRERLSAAEAYDLGLVTEVVPEGRALERALEIAARLAALPALAVSLAKQTIDRMPEASRDAGILMERLAYGVLVQTEDARDASAAFVEKRGSRSGDR